MNELKKLREKIRKNEKFNLELCNHAEKYCKDKLFRIIGDVYYSGYQNNLKGRICKIKPALINGELQFLCTIYNKRTKQIDIKNYYYYPLEYFEEIKEND